MVKRNNCRVFYTHLWRALNSAIFDLLQVCGLVLPECFREAASEKNTMFHWVTQLFQELIALDAANGFAIRICWATLGIHMIDIVPCALWPDPFTLAFTAKSLLTGVAFPAANQALATACLLPPQIDVAIAWFLCLWLDQKKSNLWPFWGILIGDWWNDSKICFYSAEFLPAWWTRSRSRFEAHDHRVSLQTSSRQSPKAKCLKRMPSGKEEII